MRAAQAQPSCMAGKKESLPRPGSNRPKTRSRDPAPYPSTWSDEYLDRTIEFWQPRAERRLTREDAREMATNLIGFFRVLEEWSRDEKEEEASKPEGEKPK
jgi:hypothetical protein